MTAPPLHIAGIGCRPGTGPDEIVALVRQAAGTAGVTLDGLAAPAFRHAHPALHQAAATLLLPLRYIDDASLAAVQPLCPTKSAAAHQATGHASIAEAAALAATNGHLLAPRIASKNATCAIAAYPLLLPSDPPPIPTNLVIARSPCDEATQGPQAPPSQHAAPAKHKAQHRQPPPPHNQAQNQ